MIIPQPVRGARGQGGNPPSGASLFGQSAPLPGSIPPAPPNAEVNVRSGDCVSALALIRRAMIARTWLSALHSLFSDA